MQGRITINPRTFDFNVEVQLLAPESVQKELAERVARIVALQPNARKKSEKFYISIMSFPCPQDKIGWLKEIIAQVETDFPKVNIENLTLFSETVFTAHGSKKMPSAMVSLHKDLTGLCAALTKMFADVDMIIPDSGYPLIKLLEDGADFPLTSQDKRGNQVTFNLSGDAIKFMHTNCKNELILVNKETLSALENGLAQARENVAKARLHAGMHKPAVKVATQPTEIDEDLTPPSSDRDSLIEGARQPAPPGCCTLI